MRISKVTTRTGDEGKTSLGNGDRVSKDHPVIDFMGEVDELNSQIGLAISACDNEQLIKDLSSIQQDLFNIGGEACMPNLELDLLDNGRVEFLDKKIYGYNDELPPLKEFILPGGNIFCAHLHVCRAISRRVERACVKIINKEKKDRKWLPYLNRISDYFFVLARYVSTKKGAKEVLWDRSK